MKPLLQFAPKLSPEVIRSYKQDLERDGYIVLENVIDPNHLRTLNDRFLSDWQKFNEDGKKWIGAGQIVGHYNSKPPTTADCLFEDVLSNDTFYEITRACLGDAIGTAYTCNTNRPGSTRQSFHMDDGLDALDYLIINIPLVDVNETNGSTEIVPGTHRTQFSFSKLKEVLKVQRPLRMNMKSGSAFIRYASLWHRGTPNRSKAPRFMLSFTHHAVNSPRLQFTHPVSLPVTAKPFFDGTEKKINAVFSGNGDSARFYQHYYFGQKLKGLIKEFLFYLSPTLCETAKLCSEFFRKPVKA